MAGQPYIWPVKKVGSLKILTIRSTGFSSTLKTQAIKFIFSSTKCKQKPMVHEKQFLSALIMQVKLNFLTYVLRIDP